MTTSPLRIALLGAGHANLLAVRPLRAALPEARITLVDAAPLAVYSGMVPGLIAGRYGMDEVSLDLAGFAQRHGILFRQARIARVLPGARRALCDGGAEIPYDLAVLDIGSHAAMPEIQGFADHAVPIKPMHAALARLRGAPPGAPAAIIGGGVAGIEVALAMAQARPVTLIEAGPAIAASLGQAARRRLGRALARAGVTVLLSSRPVAVTEQAVILADGRRVASTLVLGLAGARAQDWLARDLPVDAAGFVRVSPTLQVEGHPTLFAAGDCASMTHAPRPKSGVFAVRQAPVLVRNLIAQQAGRALAPYRPQADHLRLVALGDGTALAEWRGLALEGRWPWRWKDRIDRRFMRQLRAPSPK